MIETARRYVLSLLESREARTVEAVRAIVEEIDRDEDRRVQILAEYVLAVQRVYLRRPRAADERQGWLALPEYQHVPVEVATETLEQLRARIATAHRRLASYEYSRCKPEKIEAAKLAIEEMERLEKRLTRRFAGDPALTVDGAMAAYERLRQTTRARRNQKGGKARQTIHRKSIT